ncbi:MAG: 50S ribosomal protein L4 [Desulfobulbaceae bacterium]|nr:50S ribosomal protein L4 [Desulfobulbaceae bacterium]
MAIIDVKNSKNEKIGDVELPSSVFEVEIKKFILHDIVKMQMANRRAGTACTKTRAEVSGSNAKPWRQKGTGRARSGQKRSPLWRGGGTTFGPKPRDYSYTLPKKVRRLGLCMALSSRFAEENLIVLEDLKMDRIKAKDFVGIMSNFNFDSALIVIASDNENLEKSSRNVHGFKVMSTGGLNVYDILLHKKIILTKETIGQLEARLLS